MDWSLSDHSRQGTAKIGPGDVRTVVSERYGAVVGAGERREDERYGQDLQKGEVLAGKAEPVSGKTVGAARLFDAELTQFGNATWFEKSVMVRAGRS